MNIHPLPSKHLVSNSINVILINTQRSFKSLPCKYMQMLSYDTLINTEGLGNIIKYIRDLASDVLCKTECVLNNVTYSCRQIQIASYRTHVSLYRAGVSKKKKSFKNMMIFT